MKQLDQLGAEAVADLQETLAQQKKVVRSQNAPLATKRYRTVRGKQSRSGRARRIASPAGPASEIRIALEDHRQFLLNWGKALNERREAFAQEMRELEDGARACETLAEVITKHPALVPSLPVCARVLEQAAEPPDKITLSVLAALQALGEGLYPTWQVWEQAQTLGVEPGEQHRFCSRLIELARSGKLVRRELLTPEPTKIGEAKYRYTLTEQGRERLRVHTSQTP